MTSDKTVVIALGGSIIVPNLSEKDGVNVPFLKKFRQMIREDIKRGTRFIVVAGGGHTTRVYQKAASKIVRMTNDDLDWIGIHATRLNAHLLRTIFRGSSHSVVIDHDPTPKEVRSLLDSKHHLFMASGWRPGWSTDYIAARLAQRFDAESMVIAGDTPFVYSDDPRKVRNAQPFSDMTWKEYRKLIPSKWVPGFSSPVDPVAAKLAQKEGIEARVLQGTDLANLRRAIRDKPFTGTIIK